MTVPINSVCETVLHRKTMHNPPAKEGLYTCTHPYTDGTRPALSRRHPLLLLPRGDVEEDLLEGGLR